MERCNALSNGENIDISGQNLIMTFAIDGNKVHSCPGGTGGFPAVPDFADDDELLGDA